VDEDEEEDEEEEMLSLASPCKQTVPLPKVGWRRMLFGF
jgi:hypothetical protein